MGSADTMGAISRSYLRAIGGIGLALLVGLVGLTAQARVRPYYVLRNAGGAEVKPRLLFVLDTSGSMATRAKASEADCAFDQCENGTGSQLSRIAMARAAIRQVIEASADQASFALMTFDQRTTPNGSVPSKCGNGGSAKRFRWIQWYRRAWVSSGGWTSATRNGHTGVWELCDGGKNSPYPYLRYDNLGVGSVIAANNQVGPVPASPLISMTAASYGNTANAARKVQWFPRFMGVRVNLNAATDPNKDVLYDTIGDYGKTNADLNANVWGQDFYYWPYVDGFPGYSAHEAYSGDSLGVVSEDSSASAAALYAPFYLDLSHTPVNPNYWGPASRDEAQALVLAHSSPLVEGGVDVEGGTPWKSAIGPIPAAPTQSNSIFAHSTVSSYLKFVSNVETPDACAPVTAILLTDGDPSPSNEGGWGLYKRLAALRTELNVKTYVVGFFLTGSQELNDMACAGAGACDGNQCSSPCNDTPASDWDTCADPTDPAHKCAYLTDSADELATTLTHIVAQALTMELDGGPGASLSQFGTSDGYGQDTLVQTKMRAYTEAPAWKGHVVRSLCDDPDPDDPSSAAPWCVEPSPAFSAEQTEETFGPCPQSRSWDAGACLQQTAWSDRRLYTHTATNVVIPVANGDGSATAQFRNELQAQGLISGADLNGQADAIAAFLLGKDWPAGWKLPGLATSAPVVVRRVPPYDANYLPPVNIRDPHCSGRRLSSVDADALPASLSEFAISAWGDEGKLASPSEHFKYQEAVLVGDDLGVLHAFQLNSGNELWGFVPRFLLRNVAEQAALGATVRGQPAELEEHHFGISSTVNHGWVFDDRDPDPTNHTWRHLGVFGLGPGGTEYVALDLAHMSPSAPEGPIEILWTTEDAALKPGYDLALGETWARPALTYTLANDLLSDTPDAWLVLGSGYPGPPTPGIPAPGRNLMVVDALSGVLNEQAVVPAPAAPVYEASFGIMVDPAVASQCLSRYWAERQEAYVADPAGRLFRWDLGRNTSHAADSGGATWAGTALPAAEFRACQGAGATCTVAPANNGDPFIYPAATSGLDRIDDTAGATSGTPPARPDEFLVAMISGSPYDDTLQRGSGYHSSLYLLVDDHTTDTHGGFDIPGGAPTMPVSDIGSLPHYARVALSDITRTRTFTPFPGSPTYTETGTFAPATRPLRAPRIFIRGVIDPNTGDVIDGVEVFEVTYTVYEPPSAACDSRWYDTTTKVWHIDQGATYEIVLRLVANADGFNFTTGAAGPSVPGFPPGFNPALTLTGVTQVSNDGCTDGNCGAKLPQPRRATCDNNAGASGGLVPATGTVTFYRAPVSGFTAVE